MTTKSTGVLAALVSALIAGSSLCLLSVRSSEAAETVPYHSFWGDYDTSIPDGWRAAYDAEETHYTEVTFRGPEPGYSLAIRYHSRFSTHRLSDGRLEMFESAGDYIKQTLAALYGAKPDLVEPVHEVQAGGQKGSRFVARYTPVPDPALFGGLVGDEIKKNPGQHAYTVVASPNGFYALAYFAPQGGYEKYAKYYDQMLGAFALTSPADGPRSPRLPGYVTLISQWRGRCPSGTILGTGLDERGDLGSQRTDGPVGQSVSSAAPGRCHWLCLGDEACAGRTGGGEESACEGRHVLQGGQGRFRLPVRHRRLPRRTVDRALVGRSVLRPRTGL